MSKYVDNFIKQHKEYFKRNKSFIKSNNWNSSVKYTQEVERLKKELLQIAQTLAGEDLEREQGRITKEIAEIGNSHQTTKSRLFKQEHELTNSIVSRLKSFIQTIEKTGDRNLSKSQKFIDDTVEIINIFIDKSDKYLNYKIDVLTEESITDEEVEFKGMEIKFQDEVFSKKIKIQDELSSLNIESGVDNLEVTFYKDKKATLVLKEALDQPDFPEIKEKIQTLSVEWDIISSNEMFINMNKKDVPVWNPNKHFFDQDPVVLQFWTEEFNKCINGININGYHIHPWLYFHLNFYKTPIVQANGKEPPLNPDLRDNEWFFVESLKEATSEKYPGFYDKALLVYGSRRFGKSVILSSLAHWKILTKRYATGSIVGGSSSDLNALTDKIQTSMRHIELPFRLDVQKQNWENGETTFGIKKDASNMIKYSSLLVQNLEDGAKKSKSQVTAGGAPSVSIYDEIGKYAFLPAYLAALPSFKTPYGLKTVVVMAGTGGEASLSKDAMNVLATPERYNILPMNWDLLERNIDPEHITWKRRNYATFFPGQMAYETGFIKQKEKFGDFLGIESDELNKITIHTTNWKYNNKYLEDELESLKNDKSGNSRVLIQQRKVQYPLDPEDTFASGEDNKFPVEQAKKKKKYLEDNGITGEKVFLFRSKINNKIDTIDASDKDVAPFPYAGGFVDAPIIIYERPTNAEDTYSLYIAGLDDYNVEESSGDSVGSFTIYKRNIMDATSNKIVATYNSRPDPHRKFHEQGHMLLEMYNAKCYMENEDIKFKDFLDLRHESENWLVKGFDPGTEYTFNTTTRRKYGWQPTSSNKKFLMGRLLEYCDENIEIEDENGNIEIIKGVERIDDIGVLEEIIGYKKGGNFDRLTSFGSSLMYDLHLTNVYITPKFKREYEKEENQKHRKRRKSGLFTNSSGGFFSS